MLRNLQSQIAALEQAEQAPVAPPLPPAPAKALLPLTYIGEETRERKEAGDDPIDAPRIDNEELDPTLRGYWRLPGTQTLLRIRGFVKTDFFYDPRYAGSWYGGLVPSSFPSSPNRRRRIPLFRSGFRGSPRNFASLWETIPSMASWSGIYTALSAEILPGSATFGPSIKTFSSARTSQHLEIRMRLPTPRMLKVPRERFSYASHSSDIPTQSIRIIGSAGAWRCPASTLLSVPCSALPSPPRFGRALWGSIALKPIADTFASRRSRGPSEDSFRIRQSRI